MSLFWTKAMVLEKGVNLEERTVEGFASTIQPDMTRDVILARAWKKSLARWKKRGSMPKFLAYHMHRLLTGHSPVLGPMLSMKVVPEGLMLKAEFAETELGNEHLHLYSIGAMDYFSVGFRIMPDGSTMDPALVQRLLVANKITALVPQEVDRVIFEADIFETSAVVLGANLGALVTASMEEAELEEILGEKKAKEIVETTEGRILRAMYAGRILERLEKCAEIIPDGAGKAAMTDPEKYIQEVGLEMTEDEARGLIVPLQIPEDDKTGRNVADDPENVEARKRIAEEAEAERELEEGIEELVHPKLSVDLATGTTAEVKSAVEKEGTVVDPLLEMKRIVEFKDHGHVENEAEVWDEARERQGASEGDLLEMSAWNGAEENFECRFVHHRRSDKKAVLRGVIASMGALLLTNEMPSGEREGAYKHLAGHYPSWQKEVPEMRAYSREELKGLEEKGQIILPETILSELRALDRDLLLDMVKRVEELEAREAERAEESKSFLENLLNAVKEKDGEPGGAGSPEHQTAPPEGEPPTAGKDGEVDGTKVLNALLGNLEKLSGPEQGTG